MKYRNETISILEVAFGVHHLVWYIRLINMKKEAYIFTQFMTLETLVT